MSRKNKARRAGAIIFGFLSAILMLTMVPLNLLINTADTMVKSLNLSFALCGTVSASIATGLYVSFKWKTDKSYKIGFLTKSIDAFELRKDRILIELKKRGAERRRSRSQSVSRIRSYRDARKVLRNSGKNEDDDYQSYDSKGLENLRIQIEMELNDMKNERKLLRGELLGLSDSQDNIGVLKSIEPSHSILRRDSDDSSPERGQNRPSRSRSLINSPRDSEGPERYGQDRHIEGKETGLQKNYGLYSKGPSSNMIEAPLTLKSSREKDKPNSILKDKQERTHRNYFSTGSQDEVVTLVQEKPSEQARKKNISERQKNSPGAGLQISRVNDFDDSFNMGSRGDLWNEVP